VAGEVPASPAARSLAPGQLDAAHVAVPAAAAARRRGSAARARARARAQALLAEDAAGAAVGCLAGLEGDEPAAPLGLVSRLVLAEPPALGAQFAAQVLAAGGLAPELLQRCGPYPTLTPVLSRRVLSLVRAAAGRRGRAAARTAPVLAGMPRAGARCVAAVLHTRGLAIKGSSMHALPASGCPAFLAGARRGRLRARASRPARRANPTLP